MMIPGIYELKSQQDTQAILQPFTASYLAIILMSVNKNRAQDG